MKAMAVPLDVEDLAEFVNLETEEEAIVFQQKTMGRDTGPDFAPAAWWNYRAVCMIPYPDKQWKFTRDLMRGAWDEAQILTRRGEKKFESEMPLLDVRILMSVFEPNDLLENRSPSSFEPFLYVTVDGVRVDSQYHPTYAAVDEPMEEYGFHKAVRYLIGGPTWRMKECLICRRRFVANHNGRKCCSVSCSRDFQIRRQHEEAKKKNWYRPAKKRSVRARKSPKRRTD